MPSSSRFGQQEDESAAKSSVDARRGRLARMTQQSWPQFLLKVLLQIVVLLALAALVVWLFGR